MNMSYCRFENTLADLRACLQALREDGYLALSFTEREAADAMVLICEEIVDELDREQT